MNAEGNGSSITKRSSTPSTSIPKKHTSKSSSSRKRQLSVSDAELSSLSSLEDDAVPPPPPPPPPPAPSSSPRKPSSKRPSPTVTTTSSNNSASKKPTAPTEKPIHPPAPPRPKYDLAPLPGTPDILTQQEQRRKMRALAAKKALEKHLLMEKTKRKKQIASLATQPPNRDELVKREVSDNSTSWLASVCMCIQYNSQGEWWLSLSCANTDIVDKFLIKTFRENHKVSHPLLFSFEFKSVCARSLP